MTKQEFLAMSLPYGLNCEVRESGLRNPKTSKMVMCGTNCCVMLHMAVSPEVLYNQVKPILRPLSDLTKEIEHKGEKFVPINRIKESQYHLFFRGDITSPLEGLQFSELRKLIEWHFNLMDKEEEFIDVNTLEVNPYK